MIRIKAPVRIGFNDGADGAARELGSNAARTNPEGALNACLLQESSAGGAS